MSARQFTFTHTLERSLVDACGWEGEYEVELVVTYSVTPGQPERGPSYACGGTPAEPAEVEIISVKLDGEEELLTADENDALQAACDARAEEAPRSGPRRTDDARVGETYMNAQLTRINARQDKIEGKPFDWSDWERRFRATLTDADQEWGEQILQSVAESRAIISDTEER
jgi:hypothetical protein